MDVLGDARADRYRFALETVAADPNVDGMLVVLTPQAMTEIEATAQAVGELVADDRQTGAGLLYGRGARSGRD